MFLKERYLSAVLLFSILSTSWANDGSDYDTEAKRSGGALSYAGQVVGSSVEGLAHLILLIGTHSSGQNPHERHKFAQWSIDMLEKIPGIGKSLTRPGSNDFLQKTVLLSQLTRLLPVANDYVCGMMTVSLEDGWYIDSVIVNQGSIQNDSQFEHIGDNIFIPKNRGLTNLLMVKQTTGWTTAANSYVLENPVDFYLTVSDGREMSTLNLQKSSCTLYSYGKASVSVVKGDEVQSCVTNAGTDTKVSTLTAITSAYGKPALVRIPGEACESH